MKNRRYLFVSNCIKECILNSNKSLGQMITYEEIQNWLNGYPDAKFDHSEVNDTLRYLVGKGFLDHYSGGETYKTTVQGYDEWLYPKGPSDPRRIFLSYNKDSDGVLAGKVKEKLEENGFSVFLAHEDIIIGAESREKMLRELSTCGALLALRTRNYVKPYTEQECGFALALDKQIFAFCIGTKPTEMGFCGTYQAKEIKTKLEDEKKVDIIVEHCRKLI